jgi:IPT/TIG domain
MTEQQQPGGPGGEAGTDQPDGQPDATRRRAGRALTLALGVLMLLLGAVLVYLIVAVWPAVRQATEQAAGGGAPPSTRVELIGAMSLTLDPDAALLVLVVITGAFGSYVHAATSFADYVGNRTLASSWLWWYLLRVFIGVALAVIFYLAVRGGFLAAQADASSVNPYGVAALAGLVGMFSKQATDKLEETFSSLFRVEKGDAERKDKLTPAPPALESIEPARVPRGKDAKLLLRGQRFVSESAVRVTRVGEVPPKAVVFGRGAVTNTTIEITIPASELQEPGQLEISVVNPDAAGGASDSRRVDVEDIEQAAAGSSAPGATAAAGQGGRRGILGRLRGA